MKSVKNSKSNLQGNRKQKHAFKLATRIKTKIYFPEKQKSSTVPPKSEPKDDTEKIHPTNRDTEYNEHSQTWTFLESLADSFHKNRNTFLMGFMLAVGLCGFAFYNNPDNAKYLNEPLESRELDQPLGYQRTIQRQKEQNPDLYDA